MTCYHDWLEHDGGPYQICGVCNMVGIEREMTVSSPSSGGTIDEDVMVVTELEPVILLDILRGFAKRYDEQSWSQIGEASFFFLKDTREDIEANVEGL